MAKAVLTNVKTMPDNDCGDERVASIEYRVFCMKNYEELFKWHLIIILRILGYIEK